jgi:sugar lactone lactonase YvrE
MSAAPLRRSVRIARVLIPAIATVIGVACGGDNDGGTTGPPATGTIAITVTQVPGTSGTIHVTGPSGYNHSLTATTTLDGLPVGTYVITADSVSVPDTIVGALVYNAPASGTSINLGKNATLPVAINYSVVHRHGALWFASPDNEEVWSFGVDHLRAEGTIAPQTKAFSILPNGIAFDAAGMMWVSALDEDTLRAFSIAQRSAPGEVQATLKLQSPDFVVPEQIAFDKNGTLWISDYYAGLLGFTAAQLAAGGGGITPAFHITDTLTANPGLQSITFDSEGNAWVAEALANQVVKYSVSQLSASGSIAPALRLTNLNAPVDLAFDSHGNLWVANENSGVVGYALAQLSTSGAPVPQYAVAVAVPKGLAFDNTGDLWVSSRLFADIEDFKASTLTAAEPTLVGRFMPDFSSAVTFDNGKIAFDPYVVAPPVTAGGSIGSRVRSTRRQVRAN